MAFDQSDLLQLCLRLHRCDGRLSPGAGGGTATGQRDLLRGRFQRARRCAVPDRPVFPRRQCRARGGRRRQVAVPDRGLRFRRGVRRDQGRGLGAIRLAVGLDRMGRHRRLHGLEHQAGAGGRALRQSGVQPRRQRGERGLWRVPSRDSLRRKHVAGRHGGNRRGSGAGSGRDAGQQRGSGGRAESRGRDYAASAAASGSDRAAAASDFISLSSRRTASKSQRSRHGIRRAAASCSIPRRVEPDRVRGGCHGETG